MFYGRCVRIPFHLQLEAAATTRLQPHRQQRTIDGNDSFAALDARKLVLAVSAALQNDGSALSLTQIDQRHNHSGVREL